MKKITSDKLNQSIKQVAWTNSKGQKQISYYLKNILSMANEET